MKEKLTTYVNRKAKEIFKQMKEMEKDDPGMMERFVEGWTTVIEWALGDIYDDVKSGKIELPESGKIYKEFVKQFREERYMRGSEVTETDVWFSIVDDLICEKIEKMCQKELAS